MTALSNLLIICITLTVIQPRLTSATQSNMAITMTSSSLLPWGRGRCPSESLASVVAGGRSSIECGVQCGRLSSGGGSRCVEFSHREDRRTCALFTNATDSTTYNDETRCSHYKTALITAPSSTSLFTSSPSSTTGSSLAATTTVQQTMIPATTQLTSTRVATSPPSTGVTTTSRPTTTMIQTTAAIELLTTLTTVPSSTSLFTSSPISTARSSLATTTTGQQTTSPATTQLTSTTLTSSTPSTSDTTTSRPTTTNIQTTTAPSTTSKATTTVGQSTRTTMTVPLTTTIQQATTTANMSYFTGCFPPSAVLTNLTSSTTGTDQASQLPCQFPFHYKYQRYFSCIRRTTSEPPGCITTAGVWATCVNQPTGFVALNSTFVVKNGTPAGTKNAACVGNWITLMHRFDGSMTYNKPWLTYRNGFGDPLGSNYWLGNEYVYKLTSAGGYKLRIDMQSATTGLWYFAEYTDFSLSNETTGYRLNVGQYSGNAGDSFNYLTNNGGTGYVLNGMRFGTYDNDIDNSQQSNCASQFASSVAWWWNNCAKSWFTGPWLGQYGGWATLGDLALSTKGTVSAVVMMFTKKN